ncbi:hypothetical protein [Coraliomargarita parva]|uniref:hypothetical protein n=1 Tax=Coraliomargarita parva TaxID=3014050 RepID=UPI0022B400D5|nr:hypothetical protein [Coraliomargarita parva]
MLEVSGDDIFKLSDADLRSLIGLLCESEMRALGHSSSGVTWGGDQDASDGGVDVRVSISSISDGVSFVPRKETVFQVKKPDLSRSGILKEMQPNGDLRDSIQNVGELAGAYVIVSSGSNLTDKALRERLRAMREAIAGTDFESTLHLDFYDRGRVASWVREHPSFILWVKERIGVAVQGWRAYGNWSNKPSDASDVYLHDNSARIYKGASISDGSNGLSVEDGLLEIRDILSSPKASVRLVGLSGVGKTRFLEALFDSRIGERSLNPSCVFYTDIASGPSPEPLTFAENVDGLFRNSVLVVDNCGSDLHRELTALIRSRLKHLSLITVEYDIREDQPEGTDVFQMGDASIEVIEKLVCQRYKNVSQVDSKRIAEFSGGNARIAIALSETVERHDSLVGLRDRELFKRLFWQGREVDNRLLIAAETLSLVYSFQADGDGCELPELASFSSLSARELYRYSSELSRRGLLQRRGVWRAVLPHAVANQLALAALENCPVDQLRKAFGADSEMRIFRSFSRRLGYLHESKIAVSLVSGWLSKGGVFGDIGRFTGLDLEVLKNIAPVEPDLVLAAVERAVECDKSGSFTSKASKSYHLVVRLVCDIAYEAEFFSRSMRVVLLYAIKEEKSNNMSNARERLHRFFWILLSGTNALPQQRLSLLQQWFDEGGVELRVAELAVECLNAALQSSHFMSSSSHDFGARKRDYGYWPKTQDEVEGWYRLYLDFARRLALSGQHYSEAVKTVISKNFRGLWQYSGLRDLLGSIVEDFSSLGPWNEGWIAIKSTLRYDREVIGEDMVERLKELSRVAAPVALKDRIRLYALTSNHFAHDIDETVDGDPHEALLRVHEITYELGCELSEAHDVFDDLIRDCMTQPGVHLYDLGRGLAGAAKSPMLIWNRIVEESSGIEGGKLNLSLASGFLSELSLAEQDSVDEILDSIIPDHTLFRSFLRLQLSLRIGKREIERIVQFLKHTNGVAVREVETIAYGRRHQTISDDDLLNLMKIVSKYDGGDDVCLEILAFRYGKQFDDSFEVASEVRSFGQILLSRFVFSHDHQQDGLRDHTLSLVFGSFLNQEDDYSCALDVSRNMAVCCVENYISAHDYTSSLKTLIKCQPQAFLEGFFVPEFDKIQEARNFIVNPFRDSEKSVLSDIDVEVLGKWLQGDPATRCRKFAILFYPFEDSSADGLVWSKVALKILRMAPEPDIVLDEFEQYLCPNSWSGSRALIMEKRLSVLLLLRSEPDIHVSEWIDGAQRRMCERIELERRWEAERAREENERFE